MPVPQQEIGPDGLLGQLGRVVVLLVQRVSQGDAFQGAVVKMGCAGCLSERRGKMNLVKAYLVLKKFPKASSTAYSRVSCGLSSAT